MESLGVPATGASVSGPAPLDPATDRRPPRSARRVPIVAIASGKGGVGKTCLAVNLSIALAQRGLRATLLDADLGMANADVLCGLTPRRRLDDALRARGRDGTSEPIRQIAVRAPGGFLLVPGTAGLARPSGLDPDARAVLLSGLAALERDSDIILIDSAAGVGRDVMSFVLSADHAIVVATPEPASITDAYGLVKVARLSAPRRQARPRLTLVVNQVGSEDEARAVHGRISRCAEAFLGAGVPLMGWISHDAAVPAAVRRRCPHLVHSPRSAASADVRALAGVLALRCGVERRRSANVGAPSGGSQRRDGGVVRRMFGWTMRGR